MYTSGPGDMAQEFDTQPPKTCLRLYEMRASQLGEPAVSPSIGAVLRVLAASRPGGVFLSLCHAAGEAGGWILDGMDLASRLVVVVVDTDEAERLREVFADDLRVTVHVQDAVTFLTDVRDHRFDLLTDLNPTPSAPLARLSLARLVPGGLFVTRQRAAALAEMVAAALTFDQRDGQGPDADAFALAHLPGELGITLIVRRPPRPPMKRRGGRRARDGVTPLHSSRPRGSGR